jgi:hypothetical protein
MSRRSSVALTLTAFALLGTATTLAATRAQPSDRSCLTAWNSPGNDATRLRLLAQRPISGLRLLPGRVGADTWTTGSPPTQTAARACLLTLAKSGEIRTVTGIWRAAGITRWSFGRPTPSSKPFFANVRLLSDGRVTKIYRR